MSNTTDNLIKALRRLDEMENVRPFKNGLLDHTNNLVSWVSQLASETLIDREGNCLWDEIEKVRNAGYYVYPYEKDRFGWLIGGIETKHGNITFG